VIPADSIVTIIQNNRISIWIFAAVLICEV